MECQIQGDIPPQEVQWLFNGQEVVQSDRVEMSYVQDLGLAHLTVHQVGPGDSGEYTCVVKGEVVEPSTRQHVPKTISSTSQVTITGKPCQARSAPLQPQPQPHQHMHHMHHTLHTTV